MDNNLFQDFLKSLAGYEIRLREIHWNAITLAEHKLAETVQDSVAEFKDQFAECGFGHGYEKFISNSFSPELILGTTIIEMLEGIENLVLKLKSEISFSDELASFAALIDDFVSELKRFKYLSKLN